MSSGTNSERITQNNTIITGNNTDLDALKTRIQNLPTRAVTQSKSVAITENGTTTVTPDSGYDGLDEVEIEVNVPIPTSFPPNWSQIGYSETPPVILNDFEYSKQYYDDWNPESTQMISFYGNAQLRIAPFIDTKNVTSMSNKFYSCTLLTSLPLYNTSNVTDMSNMVRLCSNITNLPQFDTRNVTNMNCTCYSCTKLKDVPVWNTSNVIDFKNAFYGCGSLSDESLNNILAMCINATSYTATKTLKNLGLTSAQATTCQSLSNWDAFVTAGWTTGY